MASDGVRRAGAIAYVDRMVDGEKNRVTRAGFQEANEEQRD